MSGEPEVEAGRTVIRNHHRAECVLPVLSVGDETSRINRDASLHGVFHHLVNLGINSAPDVVERGTVKTPRTDLVGR